MNTRNRMKTALSLAVVLGIFGLFGGSLQAVVLVYEPFDYTAGVSIDGLDVNATGLTGTWSGDDCTIGGGTLSYSTLPVAGNRVVFTIHSSGECQASLDPATMAGKLDDGDELWFSFIADTIGSVIANYQRLQIGADSNNNVAIYVNNTTATTAQVRASITVGGTTTVSSTSATYTDAAGRLVVGRVIFGATDTVEVYLPGPDLALPASPAGTVTGSLDQSTFDMVRLKITNGNTLTADEIRIGTKYEDASGWIHPMQPSPDDGETVSAGDVELSWTNLPSNEPNDSVVWVDVWFGTDPNDLDPNNLGTPDESMKVVDAGENTTSVIVNAPVIGEAYYWRVDSYLYGSPTGDPNKGDVWTFYAADLPPSTVTVDDMITWSGEPVQLAPTIDDDGHSDLSYNWNVVYPDGVTVELSNPSVAEPTVTITKIPGVAQLLINGGFEDDVLDDGYYTYYPTDWEEGWYDLYEADSYVWDGYPWGAGVFNPDAGYGYDGIAPEGENIAFVATDIGYDMGLRQILSSTLQANVQYDLSALVGNPSPYNEGATADYRIELLAGEVVIASDSGPSPADDTYWTTASLSFTPDIIHPKLGEPLEIRLIAASYYSGYEVNFDDVKLVTDNPSVPVTLTVGVNDASNPATIIKDSMMIYVYDDACAAAKGAGLTTDDNPADFDADCTTDLEDFVEMALTWLYDYTLTEPVEKP